MTAPTDINRDREIVNLFYHAWRGLLSSDSAQHKHGQAAWDSASRACESFGMGHDDIESLSDAGRHNAEISMAEGTDTQLMTYAQYCQSVKSRRLALRGEKSPLCGLGNGARMERNQQ